MTYTIFARGLLTLEQCEQADNVVPSGMIECAYDDIISFHDLNMSDVKTAYEFMKNSEFEVQKKVYAEHYSSECTIELEEVKDGLFGHG